MKEGRRKGKSKEMKRGTCAGTRAIIYGVCGMG